MTSSWPLKMLLLTVIAIVYSLLLHHLCSPEDLMRVQGWVLLGLFIFEFFLTVVRKMPFFSVFNARFWSQMHIYVGLFSAFVLYKHLSHIVIGGLFEKIFFIVLLAVLVTGLVGIIFFRRIPKRIAYQQPVLFERIPYIQKEILQQAKQVSLELARLDESKEFVDYFNSHLFDFFSSKQYAWFHLFHSRGATSKIFEHLRHIQHCLDDEGSEKMDQLLLLVRQKCTLDSQYAHLFLLKRWIFIHIPLAYILIVFIVLHVALISSFSFVG
jgi:hypothetical protein